MFQQLTNKYRISSMARQENTAKSATTPWIVNKLTFLRDKADATSPVNDVLPRIRLDRFKYWVVPLIMKRGNKSNRNCQQTTYPWDSLPFAQFSIKLYTNILALIRFLARKNSHVCNPVTNCSEGYQKGNWGIYESQRYHYTSTTECPRSQFPQAFHTRHIYIITCHKCPCVHHGVYTMAY